jgi:hypothetical protein
MEPDFQVSAVSGDEQTIWEGEKKSLTNAATGGKVTGARYRLTAEMIYFEAGLLSSSSEQVPMWALRDVDVKQSMTQKARKVGDVIVRLEASDYTGRNQVTLDSIEDPKGVRDLLNRLAVPARLAHQALSQTVHYSGSVPNAPATSTPPAPAAAAGPSVVDQLKQLAELRDAGILDDAEFAAQKAKILAG